MSFTKTFDPKKFIITFGAVAIVGFADGPFITVTPAADRFSKTVGADGEVGRNKSNNNTHEVTITLLQTSVSNDYLSTILRADKLANAGKLPLQIVDTGGTTIMSWKEAWIRTPADVEGAKEITDRAWVFDTGQISVENIGGNLA